MLKMYRNATIIYNYCVRVSYIFLLVGWNVVCMIILNIAMTIMQPTCIGLVCGN